MWCILKQSTGNGVLHYPNHQVISLTLLSLCVTGLFSLNIDTKHPIVFQGANTDPSSGERSSSKADTSFGQSVALSVSANDGTVTLLVGAPRANSTLQLPSYADVRQPGVLYKCSVHSEGSCSEVLVDRTGNTFAPDFSYKDLKNGGCLGASMDVQFDGEGRVVVCAPRWINQKHPSHFLANGACYMTGNEIEDNKFKKLTPLLELQRQYIYHNGIYTYLYSYGQAGLSVHFPDNGKELLMGAPGIFDWTGGLIRLSIPDQNSSRFLLQSTKDNSAVFEPNPYMQGFERYDYFGYALSSGVFYSDQKTSYLVGAPNGENGHGRVLLMRFPDQPDTPYTIHAERSGTVYAEYFGSAVLAIDLTGDGLCELVVGAPFYSSSSDSTSQLEGKSSYDVGRVYVFDNYGDGSFQQKGNVLYGSGFAGGRFGSAISRLYDLDRDGIEDMAVGEPYGDEGRGLVYIFRGSKSLSTLKHSQIIYARNILPSLRGFGASFSRGVDIDNNNYPDLAIGAPLSGDSVLLRSRPIIVFASQLSSNPQRLKLDDNQLTIHACIKYDGKFVPDQLKVSVIVELLSPHPNNLIFAGDNFAQIAKAVSVIKHNVSACNSFKVQIADKGMTDYTKPVMVRMRYHTEFDQVSGEATEITYIPTKTDKHPSTEGSFRRSRRQTRTKKTKLSDGFCSTCPIINPQVPDQQEKVLEVPYSLGCGDDAQCQSDLQISTSFSQILADGFVVGSSKTISMIIAVKNTWEPALLTSLSLHIPSGVTLVRLPKLCRETAERSHLTCNIVPHPFTNISQYNQTLEFDVRKLSVEPSTMSRKQLWFNISVSTASDDLNPDDNSNNVSLPLLWQTSASISGRPLQESILFDRKEFTHSNSSNNSDTSKYVQHTYTVLKSLVSPLFAVVTTFLVPVAIVTDSGSLISITDLYQPDAFINSQRFQCRSDNIHFTTKVRDGESIFNSLNTSDIESFVGEHVDGEHFSISPVSDATSLGPDRNLTLTLDCRRSTKVRCARIECESVALLTNSDRASVTLSLLLHLSRLKSYLEKIDYVEIVSYGRVDIQHEVVPVDSKLKENSIETYVITELIADKSEPTQISVWIMIGAIVGGLMLLALFTYGLHLGGFFERKYRNELERLKASEYPGGGDFS